MINFQIEGSLPFQKKEENQFPQTIAINPYKIIFVTGNILHIAYYPKEEFLDIQVISDLNYKISGQEEMRDFLRQFPPEIFKEAEHLYEIYNRLVMPF